MTITVAIALILVALRVYVRLKIVRKFGVEDSVILLAMVCAVIALLLNGLLVSEGFGKHVVYVTSDQQTMLRKWNFALQIPIPVGTALSKISISLLLLRLLGMAVTPIQKFILHGINVFVCIYTIMYFLQALSGCTPVAKHWDQNLPGKCVREDIGDGFRSIQGACSAAVAFTLSCLPVLFFGNLKLDFRTRVVVCLLMSLGIFDGVCAIVRLKLLKGYLESLDYPYTAVPVIIWANLELTFAIMAACIPTLRPLFRSFDDGKAGDYQSSRRSYLRQSDTAQDRAFRSNQIPTAGTDYSLTTFEASHSDSRSERSTQPLVGPWPRV